jgi:hypothetical protein
VDRTDRPHLTMLRTLVRPWSRTASNAIHSPPWAASDLLSMPHPPVAASNGPPGMTTPRVRIRRVTGPAPR